MNTVSSTEGQKFHERKEIQQAKFKIKIQNRHWTDFHSQIQEESMSPGLQKQSGQMKR